MIQILKNLSKLQLESEIIFLEYRRVNEFDSTYNIIKLKYKIHNFKC